MVDPEKVAKEPAPLPAGFEWVTMDLFDHQQVRNRLNHENYDFAFLMNFQHDEVYDLLCNHYVEDHESMFRFKYSSSFLKWWAFVELYKERVSDDLQGTYGTRLAEGVACRCSRITITEACGVYIRNSRDDACQTERSQLY